MAARAFYGEAIALAEDCDGHSVPASEVPSCTPTTGRAAREERPGEALADARRVALAPTVQGVLPASGVLHKLGRPAAKTAPDARPRSPPGRRGRRG